MIHKLIKYSYSIICLLLFQCGIGQLSSSIVYADNVDNLFQDYHPNNPGYAIGITQNGKLVYQKYIGLANVEYNIPIDSNSVFDVGSVSKQFTAACIAILEMQGKLSADDPITKYMPEFPPVYAQVKIKNLIYHTSGIRQWEMLEMLAGRDSERDHYTNDTIIALLKNQKGLNFKPGDKYQYCNGGYMILAEIIKKVSGESLKDYAKEHIFKPLDMDSTFFVDDQQQLFSHRVIGYRRNDDKSPYECIDNNDSYGGGNLHTTVSDLSKWENNYIDNKLGYGDSFTKLLLTSGKLNNGQPVGYGYGVELSEYDGLPVISHNGYWPGFRTRILIIPKLDYCVTFITNSSDDIHSDSTAFDIAQAYSPQLFEHPGNSANPPATATTTTTNPDKKPKASYTDTQLEQLAGFYYSAEINKVFLIHVVKNHLALQIDDDDLDLETEQPLRFSFQGAMVLSFVKDKQVEGFTLDVGDDVKGLSFAKLNYVHAPTK